MGQFINFCAGTNMEILPAKHVQGLLVNVPYDAIDEKKIANTVRMIKYSEAEYIQLDSGGYQLSKYELQKREINYDPDKPGEFTKDKINLAPRHVIDAATIVKPTIVNALDYPIGDRRKLNERKEFMQKLGMNAGWAIECAELRSRYCPEVRLFLPVQAYDLKQFELYLQMIGGISYDGFSIPTRNFSLRELTLFLVAFYRKGVRQVHVLGSTEFFTIALSAYVAKHLFDWVSLDATSWRQSAQDSHYLNNHDLSTEPLYNVTINESIQMDCPCPWCSGRTFTYVGNLPQTERIDFLRCHNFWVIDAAFKDLHANAGSIPDLERHLRSRSRNSKAIDDLIETLCLVDALKDGDIEILKRLLNERNPS